jgi:hypothetical protein
MRRLALAASCLLITGCSLVPSVRAPGPRTPATRTPATRAPATRISATRPSPLAIAQATHEYPAAAVSERVLSPSSDAVDAVRRFATAYTNWTAADVSADMAALAQQSLGQARSALELAAAQTAQDYELQRGGVANHGTVEAVVPMPGAARRFIVVTREQTTATDTSIYQGLAPAWHVALATVSRLGPGRWAVSAWEPQS